MAAELDSQPKSIQSLYSWYSQGLLWVNRRYQRKLVWTLAEKQKLVESVLQQYPIPAVLLAEREGGGYELIDGLQRIHTLMSFIEESFATEDGRYFDVRQFPTANTRAKEGLFETHDDSERLSPREVGTFLDYSMAISVMRGATDAEIDEVFARINTYGHRLSDQERRQAGVRDEFPRVVRDLACNLRGDVSSDILPLGLMPSISIDLPMTKHGYHVAANEVFWVEQGVLRSTDLRDSMDEQCIADIAASIVGGQLLPRSKEALDAVYETGSAESERVTTGLDSYGRERFEAEFKFVIDEIRKVCDSAKLRDFLFHKRTTNAFPALFSVLFIAFHELLISHNLKIADYPAVKAALTNLSRRVDTSRGSTSAEERRQNVNTIQGLIRPELVPAEARNIYGDHAVEDVDAIIRRSEIEAPHYELKQGILRLDEAKSEDPGMVDKILRTIAAISNNGKGRDGTLLIGVADKPSDAERVKALYSIEPRKVGRKSVVGVRREADAMGCTAEEYVGKLKTAIRNAPMSEPLKGSVLSSIAYVDYFGLGVVVIRVPGQNQVSLLGEKVYVREVDETVEVTGAGILEVAKRFS